MHSWSHWKCYEIIIYSAFKVLTVGLLSSIHYLGEQQNTLQEEQMWLLAVRYSGWVDIVDWWSIAYCCRLYQLPMVLPLTMMLFLLVSEDITDYQHSRHYMCQRCDLGILHIDILGVVAINTSPEAIEYASRCEVKWWDPAR